MMEVTRNVGSKVNPFAVASLIVGILWLYGLGSVLAVILGHSARRQIAASNGTQTGLGLATAGTVVGWIGIALTLLLTVLLVFGRAA